MARLVGSKTCSEVQHRLLKVVLDSIMHARIMRNIMLCEQHALSSAPMAANAN